ncbi:nitroreductase [Frankia sp. CNm7]|uniref:Nitroreductase n=1 Tax=Frankia nepalensis TaxID=1836974 RepID=A0A937RD02_9ACTN|nr:nitroreductase [Frankia nepalensis]MBL7496323.1 nitroreductase [Frankia nepalensis]MBL7508480.1 nitroreductase [Frankia nepalensis]MBL7521644.1 nitroreductase [Frankia nepalensis]MBL7627612.1 nitroreductase [Frankia nepalensis]
MVTHGTTISRDQVHAAVEAANLAPSIHNSQPWRWRFRDDALELSADLGRALPVADPDHRQLLVSCGAALLNGWLALRAAGLDVEVAELPDGPDIATGRLAALRIVGLRPPTDEETRLAAAVGHRHTDRRPFEPAELPADAVRELRHAAEAEGCWLASLTSEQARVELAVLLARADWVEQHDPAYQTELAAWTRADPDATDGVPLTAAPGSGEPRRSEFALRSFAPAGETGAATGGAAGAVAGAGAGEAAGGSGGAEPGPAPAEPPVEHPGVLVLGTDADGPADRLRAGRGLGRVLLTATAAGLATSPLGQAIDMEATRALVRSATGGTGHTQMILRVGYPDHSAPPLTPTGRRPVAEVLEEFGTPPAS